MTADNKIMGLVFGLSRYLIEYKL